MLEQAKAKATMACPAFDIRCASFGKHRNGLRRFRCGECGKTYTEAHANLSLRMGCRRFTRLTNVRTTGPP